MRKVVLQYLRGEENEENFLFDDMQFIDFKWLF